MWRSWLSQSSLEVVLISAYNRYSDHGHTYYRAVQPNGSNMPSSERPQRAPDRQRPEKGAASAPGPPHRPQEAGAARLLSFFRPESLGRILPAGIDPGDILLAVMLFLLYIDTKDEDFLIILIVVGYSIFNDIKKQQAGRQSL